MYGGGKLRRRFVLLLLGRASGGGKLAARLETDGAARVAYRYGDVMTEIMHVERPGCDAALKVFGVVGPEPEGFAAVGAIHVTSCCGASWCSQIQSSGVMFRAYHEGAAESPSGVTATPAVNFRQRRGKRLHHACRTQSGGKGYPPDRIVVPRSGMAVNDD